LATPVFCIACGAGHATTSCANELKEREKNMVNWLKEVLQRLRRIMSVLPGENYYRVFPRMLSVEDNAKRKRRETWRGISEKGE